MSLSKIQKGDNVKIIAGNYKGQSGQIIKVVKSKKGKRVAVTGVEPIAKFRSSYVHQGQKYPGIQSSVDRLINISNVMILDENQKTSRVITKIEDGKKSRIYKTTKTVIISNSKSILSNKSTLPSTTENTVNN
jgi:large subunit ribosomal protein L24